MKINQDQTDITCAVLRGLRKVIKQVKPNRVIVHGVTSTTLAATLAAYYQHIPVGHVEAGLRTGDPYSSWREEINRRLTWAVADLHFAPSSPRSL